MDKPIINPSEVEYSGKVGDYTVVMSEGGVSVIDGVGDFCARDTFDKHEDALQGTLSEEQTQQIAEEAVKEYESEFLNPGQ